ncbi:hypothetical protein EVAR_71003_1, partial [Eumeta japonica]
MENERGLVDKRIAQAFDVYEDKRRQAQHIAVPYT